MFKMKLTFNGKRITSGAQLEREFRKSIDAHVEKSLRRAAGPGVKLRKSGKGYLAEGSRDDIERMKRRLASA